MTSVTLKISSNTTKPIKKMGVLHVASTEESSSAALFRKRKNRRKLNRRKGTQAIALPGPSSAEGGDGLDEGMEELEASTSERPSSENQSATTQRGDGGGEDDDALMIDADSVPVRSSGAPVFAPLAPSALKAASATKGESRRVPIPPHRMSPLKKDWINIFGPLTELLGLQVRMNVQRRCVEMRVSLDWTFRFGHTNVKRHILQTSKHTKDIGAIQKGADFVKAFALGFDVNVSTCVVSLLNDIVS